MRRRWVLAGVLVVVMLCLGGYALARPGSKPKVSGWWSYPPLATTRQATVPRSYPITRLSSGKLRSAVPNGNCPAEPRPLPGAGVAYAAQAALSQARQDYPELDAKDAQVMAADRSAFAGPRGQQVAHQCGQKVANRTVVVQLLFPHMLPSASLSEGVVFVSSLSRGYRVWEIAHGGSAPPAPSAQTEYDCGAGGILAARGPLISAAQGTVGGHHWVLETDQGRPGASSVRAGRFLLDGHVYGICRDPVDLELIDAAPHGIVYGFAPRPFIPPIVIEATTAHGTATHPVPAHQYPATTLPVPGGTLFVRALPASACAYNNLAVSLPRAPTRTGGSSETILGQFLGACHSGRLVPTPHQGFEPSPPAVLPPAGLSAAKRAQFITGRAVVGRAGCLACHQIGNQGNPGPGAPLTDIGGRLNSSALAKNLVDPPAPMPSFRSLSGRDRRAVVAFLSELRR